MANWEVTKTTKHGKPIEEHTAKIGKDQWKIESMPHISPNFGSLNRWDDLRGLRQISTGNIEMLKRQAEAISTKKDSVSDLLRGFSRPGAPDTFAVEDRFYFGKGRKERFASKEQALAFIKQYKRNEDSNAHSENVVLLAKFMGNSRAAKLASLVQQINEVAGHMPHGVGQFQYNELHAPLWKQFIAQYGDLYASVK